MSIASAEDGHKGVPGNCGEPSAAHAIAAHRYRHGKIRRGSNGLFRESATASNP
jgi:hypothetical protein